MHVGAEQVGEPGDGGRLGGWTVEIEVVHLLGVELERRDEGRREVRQVVGQPVGAARADLDAAAVEEVSALEDRQLRAVRVEPDGQRERLVAVQLVALGVADQHTGGLGTVHDFVARSRPPRRAEPAGEAVHPLVQRAGDEERAVPHHLLVGLQAARQRGETHRARLQADHGLGDGVGQEQRLAAQPVVALGGGQPFGHRHEIAGQVRRVCHQMHRRRPDPAQGVAHHAHQHLGAFAIGGRV